MVRRVSEMPRRRRNEPYAWHNEVDELPSDAGTSLLILVGSSLLGEDAMNAFGEANCHTWLFNSVVFCRLCLASTSRCSRGSSCARKPPQEQLEQVPFRRKK